ncbi:MAG: DUF4214 domain-containing protein [Pirellulaceae bacterium]
MSTGRTLGLAVLLLVSSAMTCPAQVYNSADYVRSLYNKYLHREPSSNELTQWVWAFQKGATLTDAQLAFLSSEDYFSRHARNPSSFVVGVYAEVLNRAPSQAEVTAWVNNLDAFRGDRQKFVREFLKAAQQEVTRREPLPSPAANAQEGQLTVMARLLRDSLEDELGGTPQGRPLSIVSRNLVNASRSLELAPKSPPQAASQAFQNVQLALTALENEFKAVRFSAPNSNAYYDRYARLFGSMSGSVAPTPLPPTSSAPPSIPPGGLDARLYNDVLRANTALASDTQQLLYLLRSMINPDGFSKQLLRDVEFFYAQVDGLEHALRVGMPMGEVRSSILRMRALAGGITQTLSQNVPLGQTVGRWNTVAEDLQELGELVGVSIGLAIDPYQPVLYNAPTYNQFPYAVQRPQPPQAPRTTIPTIDQAVAHLNAFVVSLNRFVPYAPQVVGIQTRARSLRLSLLQLRQEAATDANPRTVQTRLGEINQLLQVLAASWQQTVSASRLAAAPNLNEVTQAVQKLSQSYASGYALY